MSLDRNAFLSAGQCDIKQVEIAKLGEVFIREMGGAERDQFEATLSDGTGKATTVGMRARLVMLCVCDKDGNRLFTDDDFDAINGKPASMLQEIVEHIVDLNGLKVEDVEGN